MTIDATDIDVNVRMDLYELPRRMMDAVIRKDADQYIGCFTADGVWDPQPLARIAQGQTDIKAAFLDAWDGLNWAFQGHFHTVIADYSDDHAQLRTYLYELGTAKKDPNPPPLGIGLYVDDVVLVKGKWRVSRHDLMPIYFGTSDYSKPLFQHSPV